MHDLVFQRPSASVITRTSARLGVVALVTGLATVSLTSPSSVMAEPHQAGAAVSGTSVLRPDGDVPRFAVRSATSASAALDDAVRQPAVVPAKDYIQSGVNGSSTLVKLSDTKLGKAKVGTSKVWFFAKTGAATSLRVEVVWAGTVQTSATVKPGQGFAWRSLTFSPKTAAAVNDIQLRFTAVGGARAEVRAAYVALAVKGQATRLLRPNGDVSTFKAMPKGPAAATLDDGIKQPAAASATDYISATAAGSSTTVTLKSANLRGKKIGAGRAWFYANTGTKTTLRAEVVWGGTVRASTTIPASKGYAWRSIKFTPSTQAAVDGLQLRFTTATGAKANVRAAYANVDSANPDTPAVNAYLSSLKPITAGPDQPAHPVGSPVSSVSSPLPDPTAPSGQSKYRCTQTPYSMATSPDKIVALNPDSNKLWLGGLLQGRGYADGLGSLRELPIRKRAPLTIYTDLLGPQVATTVANPDPASVQQGISDLVNKAMAAKVPVPLRASYLQTEEQSSSQALLKLGFSAKYMGVSASAKLETNRTAQESTLLATFVQRMFTVSIVTPSTPASYFSSDFTKADLDAQKAEGRISADNPPVVVGSISYGRTLLYSVTAAASTNELSGALNAAYSGGAASGSVEVSGRQQEILNKARYQVVALGGQESDALSLIRTHKLGDYFTSQSNPATAVPISYQVNNIGDDSAARFTETTSYNLTECSPMANQQVVVGSRVRLTKPLVYMNGNRGSADIYGGLVVNGNTEWSRSRDGYQRIRLHNQAELEGWRQPDVTLSPWQLDLRADQSPRLRITGSINCRLYFPEFGNDPSNQYNWEWSLGNGYGNFEIEGGSKSCPITLRSQVTKVADLYEYRP